MAVAAEPEDRPLLDSVLNILRADGKDTDRLCRFAELVFSRSDSDIDLHAYPVETLAGLAREGWDFIGHREAGGHKVRVFNPDGLDSPSGAFTVVEMLNEDMPFLVDSLMGEIQERGLATYLVLHPILRIARDETHRVSGIAGVETEGPEDAVRESYIQVHIERLEDEAARDDLAGALESILEDVRVVVGDWKPMVQRLNRAVTAYTDNPPQVPVSDLAESVQFLKWLLDDNFTFLGMRAFAYVGGRERGRLEPLPESGLGILRNPEVYVLRRGAEVMHMTPEVRKFFLAPAPLIITKANVRSTVHRRAYMDYIGVKIYGEQGEISGELRIVGLFTSTAYTRSTKSIPFLRHKVETVLDRSGFPRDSHSGKALLNVLETFPRDELFQIGLDQLYETVTGILALELRPRARAFARIDEFDRFVSVLVFVPRDRFSTTVRMAIGDFLAGTYDGRVSAFYPFFPEGPLVRIHFIIGRHEGETPVRGQEFLDENIARIVRTWEDRLEDILREKNGGAPGSDLVGKYRDAFSAAYKEAFSPERAVLHIRRFEALRDDAAVAVQFYREEEDGPERARVALYHRHGPISLTRRVPVLENLGFSVIDERSYRVAPADGGGQPRSLHDMVLESPRGTAIDLDECSARLEDCFLAVWRGEAGNDSYNRLVLAGGADWREAAAMRAYGSYLRQIGAPFGQTYLADTLIRHTGMARDLMALFRGRFDPGGPQSLEERQEAGRETAAAVEAALDDVPSLDEDRIIRHFLNLIQSTLRTNFYCAGEDGHPVPALAFKFDSKQVEGAPQPRPLAEIFVFSPEVEGIHLRAGRIARGGIRWSDRAQDFRTEVLRLAKAQQVKNVVIVPAGAKGGFVPKMLWRAASREEAHEIGIAAYKRFVDNLLSLTDNLEGDGAVPPADVVRYDGEDPYLVVAADKGTATFSDYANAISVARGFWLGDAFASGGSAGYDHKEMGITARGAWEAVKRHFREMDRDIQSEPFTAIGVGDMSGDVFGNGMLLSQHTRLLAAFDHRDIFIDPDPDPAASFAERKRLFGMGRLSWQDYSADLISAGGGVFSRAAKSVSLTPEIKALTGLEAEAVTPNALIHALLKARADLLWFGGIGTYVGASTESDEDIGDRANDAVRVRGRELNVTVIGEGANLGMTQAARIEFARAGGRVNTDAIDNSGGVNSSDQEVNIKIALGLAVAAGKLDMEARNAFLAKMTEEVAAACLRNNYLQTLAISLGERRGFADLGFQTRLMRELERTGELDRELEGLPDDGALAERLQQGEPLTRPELAVLLAYGKIDLYEELVASHVPDDPYFAGVLKDYFPNSLQAEYPDEIAAHRLRREIIATQVTNAIINRGGSTMFVRLREETGHAAADIALAFTAAQAIFDLESLCGAVDALDTKLSGVFQLDLYLKLQDILRRQTAWTLRHVTFGKGLSAVIDTYRGGVDAVQESLGDILNDVQAERLETERGELEEAGVPAELARPLAELRFLAEGPDMVLAAETTGRPVTEVAALHFDVGAFFRLGELRLLGEQLLVRDYFDRLAVNAAIGSISDAQRALVQDVVRCAGGGAPGMETWQQAHGEKAARARRAIDEILDSGEPSLARLTVAVGHLRDLVQA